MPRAEVWFEERTCVFLQGDQMDSENKNGLLVALGLGRFNGWGDFEYGETSEADAPFIEEFWDTDAFTFEDAPEGFAL